MSNTEYEFMIIEETDRIRDKAMFAGDNSFTLKQELIYYDNKFASLMVEFIPSLTQIFLELFSNCADHYIRTKKSPQPLTEISLKFPIDNDYIFMLSNNGKGIPIDKITYKGKEYYKPEAIFAVPGCGQNMKREKYESITGGTNGIGLKILTVHSKKLKIATADDKYGYTQIFDNGLSVIHDPVIVDINKAIVKNGLTIMAVIDKKTFKEDVTEKMFADNLANFVKLIHCRFLIYYYWYNGSVNLKLNDVIIRPVINNNPIIENMALKLFNYNTNIEDVYHIVNLPVYDGKYSWRISLIVHKSIRELRRDISIVNGLLVYTGGHIDCFRAMIKNRIGGIVLTEINKHTQHEVKDNIIDSYFTIYMCCEIINPVFSQQSKNSLDLTPKQFNNIIDPKNIPNSFLINIAKKMIDVIKIDTIKENVSKITKERQEPVNYDKYHPATKLGNEKTTLFITEGNSADGFIQKGLQLNISLGGYLNHGKFPLRGVINNPRKTSAIETVKMDNGKTIILPKASNRKINVDKIINEMAETNVKACNTRGRKSAAQKELDEKLKKKSENIEKRKRSTILEELQKAIGLNYGVVYDNIETIKQLNYRNIVIATDRDQDGVGNILGLVINWFQRYWPSLIVSGIIKVLLIPVIRAIPLNRKDKSKCIMEFGSKKELDKWISECNIDISRDYDITYSKGLGSDGEIFIKMVFNNLPKYIYTYKASDDIEKLYETFYGRETKDRKIALLKKPEDITEEEAQDYENRIWSCKMHLRFEVTEYQQYNWRRKLPGLDGCISSRRKIIYGMMQLPNKKDKLDSYIGRIVEMTKYLHGQNALSGSLIYMGQNYIGARTLPMFLNITSFGSRTGTEKGSGKDNASPRYMTIQRNKYIMDTIFPKADNDILIYNYFADKRIEPTFYMPVICYSILQTEIIPAHGWRQIRWARDFNKVYDITKNMITYVRDNKITNPNNVISLSTPINGYFGIDLKQFGICKLLNINNSLYCIGRYGIREENNKVTINIFEIPPGIGVEAYYIKIKNKFKQQQYKQFNISVKRGSSIKCIMKDNKRINVHCEVDIDIEMNSASFNEFKQMLINADTERVKTSSKIKLSEQKDIMSDDSDSEDSENSEDSEDSDDDDSENGNEKDIRDLNKIETTYNETDIGNFNNGEIDIFERIFELYLRVGTELNFVVPFDVINNTNTSEESPYTIKSYKSYHAVFVDWFNLRFIYYVMRLEREIILLIYKIKYYNNLIRFINSVINKEISFDTMDESQLINSITENGYDKIIQQLVSDDHPAPYKRANQIKYMIENNESSYDYLINLRARNFNHKQIAKYQKELSECETKYQLINTDRQKYLCDLWLYELKQIKDSYDEGIRTRWQYDEGDNMDELIERSK